MNKPVLKHYARALFEVAKDSKAIDKTLADVNHICDVLVANKELDSFLDSRMVSSEEKNLILDKVFKDSIQSSTLSFLKIVTRKHLSKGFSQIRNSYVHYYNDLNNIKEGIIYSSFVLKEDAVKKITDIFSEKYQKQVVFRTVIDKRIIAGMKIYIDDTMFDYSVDTKINTIKDRLLYKKSL
ncbi:MAG: ATP synthase F1 subunit delta [Bacilli bacterium]